MPQTRSSFHRSAFVIATALCGVAMSLVAAKSAEAENWPRFRGQGGNGVSNSTSIPSEWTEKDYLWSVDLGGKGNSSPVIWSNRVFVTAADETTGQRWLACYSLDEGSEMWRAPAAFSKYKKHKNNSFASSTPAADDRFVYQLWHAKEATSLVAYDHDGNEAWRYELGPYLHGQGGATSPIVGGGVVVVAHDHKADSFLVAVDSSTGKERWKIPREGKRACYSTPCIRTTSSGNQELVFVHCYEGIIGVDLRSGKQNWHIDPFGRESQRALASPIIAGDLVIAGSGAVGGDRQIVAVRVGDESAKASEAYRLIRQSPHVPTPLVLKDRLYLWNDSGIATCCELETGERIWQKRVGGNFFASPIAIGERLFSIDTLGEVVVLAASDEFKIVARNQMPEGSRATMAVSNDTLVIRTESKLFAIGPK